MRPLSMCASRVCLRSRFWDLVGIGFWDRQESIMSS
jgi:hypothetical protein